MGQWCRIFVIVMLLIGLPARTMGQERRPLSVKDILRLVGVVTPPRLVDLIENHGVNFTMTAEVREQLSQAGADATVLAAVERAAATYRQAEDERRKKEEEAKKVEAARQKEEAQRKADTERRRREEQEQTEAARRKAEEEAKQRQGGEMVEVAAGEFLMGCNENVDRGCDDDEKTGQKSGKRVYLDTFYIDHYEVTVDKYRRCVEAGGKGCTPLATGESCNWGKAGRDNHPVNCVDWNQAVAYCEWVRKRLPSEAEWEKAARGTDGRVYPWGDQWDEAKANVGSIGTQPVGSYQGGVSPNGAFDMSGNVWEWVQDWYDGVYYQRGPSRNPKGPDSGQSKVLCVVAPGATAPGALGHLTAAGTTRAPATPTLVFVVPSSRQF